MKNYPLETVAPLSNIKEILLNGKKNCPEHIAFRYAKKDDVVEISYQKFLQDVAALSSELVSKNLFNEKIALIGENSYHWIVTYFAVVCSGNVIVPLDKELSLDEIRHIVEHSEAVALFYARDYDDVKDDLSSNSAVKHMWSLQGEVQGIFEKGTSVDVTAFEKLPVDEQKMCAIIYTSGTTGDPKGVMLSQHGLALDAYASLQNVRFKNDSLLILPLHHTFALTAAVLIPLHNQGTVAINLSLRTLADDIAKYKPQHLFLVPMIVETLYKKLIDTATKMGKMDQLPALSKMAFGGNLEIIVSGGAPINQQYIDGFKACGIYVLNGYGITECSPVVSVNRNDVQKDGSIGLILPTCEVKIIDEEICVKGDIVMLGYYKNDEATKESMSDGY
ncbi:MAG: AMP-binding protein, partial [Bacillota bacterium]